MARKKTAKAKRTTKLDKYKQVCRKYLDLGDDTFIDVIFGTVFANSMDAIPVWLYVIGAASRGKTDILISLGGHPTIKRVTKVTENTLVSGKIRGANQEDPSLLPQLNDKVVVIKDFTTILSGRYETVAHILGQLRDIYDGETDYDYGTDGKHRHYESTFGLIAGVTSAIDKHTRLVANLGERFLKFQMARPSRNERISRAVKAGKRHSESQMKKEMREAAHAILNMEITAPVISPELVERLAETADLIAIARTEIDRDRGSRDVVNEPDPEDPPRLTLQFVNLAYGIAMAREKSTVTMDEIRLVNKVAMDSIPPIRAKILLNLAKRAEDDYAPVGDLVRVIKVSRSTIKRQLEEMQLLGVAVCKKAEGTKDDGSAWNTTYWQLRPLCRTVIHGLGVIRRKCKKKKAKKRSCD